MQVFKAFLKIAFSKRVVILLYTGIFLAIAVIMTVTNSDKTQSFEGSKLSIGIIDNDDTAASQSLKDYLSKSHTVKEIDYDRDKILQKLYYMDMDYVLEINKGYEDRLKNGETDNLFTSYNIPGSYTSSLGDSVINKYTKCAAAYIASGNELSAALEKAEKTLEDKAEVEVYSEEKTPKENNFLAKTYFQFISYILLSVIISTLAPTLMVMNRTEIRMRTNTSCLSQRKQLLQRTLGTVVFGAALWIVFMAAGFILFGDKITNLTGVYAVVQSLAFTAFCVTAAMLVSVLIKNPRACDMIAVTLGLGMSFICGVFVPQEYLGSGVLAAAHALPVYWYVRGLDETFSGGEVSVSEVGICTGAVILFTMLMLVLTLLISKRNRKSAE